MKLIKLKQELKQLFKILLILFALILTSICPEKKQLPERILLNEMCIYNIRHDNIFLVNNWVSYSRVTRDSLYRDAEIKIHKIKTCEN